MPLLMLMYCCADVMLLELLMFKIFGRYRMDVKGEPRRIFKGEKLMMWKM